MTSNAVTFKIGPFEIGAGRAFVIAEIGNNHNGSFERAIEMIDQARAAGADCAKFQMRHMDQVYRQRSLSKSGDDLGTEYVIDLLNRFELSIDQHRQLAEYLRPNRDHLPLHPVGQQECRRVGRLWCARLQSRLGRPDQPAAAQLPGANA
jgi:sialic acid synthase SpsE